MNTETLISASEFCFHHGIELTFIHSLKEYGLIEVRDIDDKPFLSLAELDRIEMFVRFHYVLDINLEGIETITHLLYRMRQMQEQINELTNKLKGFEVH